jgi:hydrogenase/urease accessory protein HupE
VSSGCLGRLAAGATLALLPPAAAAHLVTTGLGPVYDGVTHLLVSLDDLLPVIALALLAGLGGRVTGARAALVLPFAWMFGGFVGFVSGMAPFAALATASSTLLLGTLVAADREWHPAVVPSLAAALGLMHGWLNGAGIAAASREPLALVGIGVTLFVLVTLQAAAVVSLPRPWMRVAVRVAGSWIAAAGLLLVGWSLRG